MKNLLRLGALLAAAATAFAACSKSATEALDADSPRIRLTLRAGNPEIAPTVRPQGTRTEMEGTIPYWSVGDRIGVSTDGTSANYPFTNDATERAQITTFSGQTSVGSTIYTYYPFSEIGFSGTGDNAGARVDIPANQTPTATSFDGRADLLIGKPLTMAADGTVVGSLQFKRMGAIVKVVLKDNSTGGLLSGQHVSALSIATDGQNYLAGRVTLNLLNGMVYDPYYGQSNKVTATYTSATQYAVDGLAGTYLGVFPRVLPAGSTLTVEASTEGYNILRTITLAQPVELLPGKVTTLNVGLQDEHITAVATGLALPFADDFSWVTTTSTKVLSLEDYPTAADGTALYSATASTYQEAPALKFGTKSACGYFTTTGLDLSRPFTVIVQAKDYGTTDKPDGSSLKVTAGEATPQTAALTTDYKYYAFEFPAQTAKSKVRVDITGTRGYVTLFQVVEGHDIQLPATLTVTSPTSVTVAAEGDIITTTYQIENPVTGASVTAVADAAWINSFDTSVAGEITYLVDANETGAARTGTITLSYAETQAQTVTINQPAIGGVTTYVATYTVTATNAVSVSGNAPAGTSAAYTQTYSTKQQLTSKNTATLTLSGYAGCKITGITLNMHSNSKAGAGGLSVTAGTTTIASVAANTTFNNWPGGKYGTAWVDITPTVTPYTVGAGETITVLITASVNSLYIQSYTITCEK